MSYLSRIVALVGAGLFFAAGQALADAPQSTTATYGDWILHCAAAPAQSDAASAKAPADTAKVCEIEQTIRLRQTGQAILKIALGKAKADAPTTLVLEVPTGVLLRPGINLSLGDAPKEKPDLAESYVRCTPQSCLADSEVSSALSKDLMAGKTMIVEFVDGSGKRVRVPTSLNGFASAFQALFPDSAAKSQ